MRINDMEFFHEASKRICGYLDALTMLKETQKYLQNYLPVDVMKLNIYEYDFQIIRTIAESRNTEVSWFQSPKKLSREAVALINSEKAETVDIINQTDTNPVCKDMICAEFLKKISCMVLHLKVDEKHLGVLTIACSGQNRYTVEHSRRLFLLHDLFVLALANLLQHLEVLRLKDMLADDNRYLAGELRQISGDKIIGEDFGLKAVTDMVRQVAPLNSHVLLLGETGVGKEVIANAIHYSSPRAKGPFIKVNCGALPEALIDSELFGHEKGAFTGAVNTKRGRFERAHGGTIFLDEIGDLPSDAQTRLLRVIQEKQIERVGGNTMIGVDIRIITATHRDLYQMVRDHTFREDLWYRLNVFPITIPPLRQRKEDIPALVQYFIRRKCHEMKIPHLPRISAVELSKLVEHQWPGNVRELENTVERALIRALTGPQSKMLVFDDVEDQSLPPLSQPTTVSSEIVSLDRLMRNHIKHVLSRCKGKVEGPDGAAELLEINPSTLRNRMRKLGVPFGKNQW